MDVTTDTELVTNTIRGAFTYILLILQERLSTITDYEENILLPLINGIDWNTNSDFWRGSLIEDIKTRPMNLNRAAARILLRLLVHYSDMRISGKTIEPIKLTLDEKADLLLMSHGMCKSYFSDLEICYLTQSEENHDEHDD